MNTSSVEFGNLISQFPSEKNAIERIERLFSEKGHEFPLENIYALAQPNSTYALANIMMKLVELGAVQKKFRVISPSDPGGGIGEYSSLIDIPENLYDPRSGLQLDVTPSLIKVIYKSSK